MRAMLLFFFVIFFTLFLPFSANKRGQGSQQAPRVVGGVVESEQRDLLRASEAR